MSDLSKLLDFSKFILKAHKVERVARTPGVKRYSNVVEHSYQLTLMAWYIIDKEKLPLNKDLVIKYSLIHDLVETYAGDTYIYDTAGKETKEKRECEAQKRIQKEFPDFEDLNTLIEKYENKADAESRFVYALDKLIDPINIYLDDGKIWHKKKITLQMLINNKTDKIKTDKTVTKYYKQLLTLLENKKDILFPN